MRLCRIWRILQIKEGVIHGGRRLRWITLSETCRILHILRKPNPIIAILFIQNISPFLKEFRHFALCFFCSAKITQARPQVFWVNGSIICSELHFWRHRFWRHRFNKMHRAALFALLAQYNNDFFSKFGQQQLVMVNYECGFNQSETGKYFESIINKHIQNKMMTS